MSATSTVIRTADRSLDLVEGRASERQRRAAVRPAVRHAARATRPAGCPSVARPARTGLVWPAAPSVVEPARHSTHLTARGRLAVLVVLVAVLLGAFSLGRTVAEGSTQVQPRVSLEQVTVLPGDTLWAVAQRLAPGQDPRPVVEQIRQINDLSGGGLQAGQQLLLPVAP